VTARTAWIAAEGEELRLRGDVRATSRNASGSEIKLASEELNVFPETKRATSAVAVTVTQPGLILNGRELEALLDSKRVSLKDIKARYERTAR
jgi:lipopolysaccharide export system protein LptC